MRLTVLVIHDVFDEVHDRLELRIEGQHDFDRNLPSFLHIHIKEVLAKEGLDFEAILFFGNDLVYWERIGFEAFFSFDPTPFVATRFTGVGLP